MASLISAFTKRLSMLLFSGVGITMTDHYMGKVLIYQHNKKVYSRALGFSNIETGVKANDETVYRIGSISKTITAVLVLKAIEEGKINYSDNIKPFFPSIEHADQVTIRHLLNHHSGIHNLSTDSPQPMHRPLTAFS